MSQHRGHIDLHAHRDGGASRTFCLHEGLHCSSPWQLPPHLQMGPICRRRGYTRGLDQGLGWNYLRLPWMQQQWKCPTSINRGMCSMWAWHCPPTPVILCGWHEVPRCALHQSSAQSQWFTTLNKNTFLFHLTSLVRVALVYWCLRKTCIFICLSQPSLYRVKNATVKCYRNWDCQFMGYVWWKIDH